MLRYMKKPAMNRTFFLTMSLFLLGSAVFAAGLLKPGEHPLDAQGRMHISQADRCPVCAMVVIKHPKFASAIQLTDGTTHYFCGTGCMIRSWMHPEVFLGVEKSALKRPVVQDYFTGAHINGLDAAWVAGSDVAGPMGPALVPLKSPDDAAAFIQRHGGKTIGRLADMDDEKWQQITGKKALK